MSVENEIINKIEKLTEIQKIKVLTKISEKYFAMKENTVASGTMYGFKLNEKDEFYD